LGRTLPRVELWGEEGTGAFTSWNDVLELGRRKDGSFTIRLRRHGIDDPGIFTIYRSSPFRTPARFLDELQHRVAVVQENSSIETSISAMSSTCLPSRSTLSRSWLEKRFDFLLGRLPKQTSGAPIPQWSVRTIKPLESDNDDALEDVAEQLLRARLVARLTKPVLVFFGCGTAVAVDADHGRTQAEVPAPLRSGTDRPAPQACR
jgi:hypothetical protein